MYTKTLNLSIILALIVVVLGAYTRLADAGLGCPDWPGCYGQLLVPDVVSSEYERPLDVAKAWKEMIHRYAASTLGLAIIVIFLFAAFRKTERVQSIKLPAFLLVLVGFQGALGMWTVTEQVHPGIPNPVQNLVPGTRIRMPISTVRAYPRAPDVEGLGLRVSDAPGSPIIQCQGEPFDQDPTLL